MACIQLYLNKVMNVAYQPLGQCILQHGSKCFTHRHGQRVGSIFFLEVVFLQKNLKMTFGFKRCVKTECLLGFIMIEIGQFNIKIRILLFQILMGQITFSNSNRPLPQLQKGRKMS